MLLIQIGRDLGKGLEKRLFQSWGGRPSAAMLRHADDRLEKPTKERYRRFLSEAVPGLTLASAVDERENPERAHAGDESANRWLLEQTRVCLLFIHPGAPNLISLRSAGTMPA